MLHLEETDEQGCVWAAASAAMLVQCHSWFLKYVRKLKGHWIYIPNLKWLYVPWGSQVQAQPVPESGEQIVALMFVQCNKLGYQVVSCTAQSSLCWCPGEDKGFNCPVSTDVPDFHFSIPRGVCPLWTWKQCLFALFFFLSLIDHGNAFWVCWLTFCSTKDVKQLLDGV